MLPKLPLDDRSYAEIVQHARRLIPKQVPQWTDENAHDPGITFIELFAWLTELQRYYASRVPDKHRLKFLEMLGVTPHKTASAHTLAYFSGVKEPITIPCGSKLMAEDQMFETDASLSLTPLELERIVVRTELEANDVTATIEQTPIAFYPFGIDAKAGAKLYMAFDRALEPGEEISIAFKLQDLDEYVNRSNLSLWPQHEFIPSPSSKLSWKAYCWDEQLGKDRWMPVDVIADGTIHFTRSGMLSFSLKSRMNPVTVHPASDRTRYWICCTLEEAGYELPPRVSRMLLNAVPVGQRDTLCERLEQILPQGERAQDELIFRSYLALYGDIQLQVQEEDGRWRYWQRSAAEHEQAGDAAMERTFTLRKDEGDGSVAIKLNLAGDSPGNEAGDSVSELPSLPTRVRVIASEYSFQRFRIIGRSKGLPGQSYELYDIPCKRSDALGIQIGYPTPNGVMLWEDWQAVDSFDHSTGEDLHYMYDPATRLLTFGNGEQGAIPPASSEANICIVHCVGGGGERGNIKPGLLEHWVSEEQRALGLKAHNPFYASGGADAETLSETLQRAQAELKQPYRAVTNEDYERIACTTPGAAVARVKAIPLFRPGLADYPREKAHGQISLVIVPHGLSETPLPSPGFLRTVKQYMDQRRLITTELHVIPPLYIQVTVHAVVVVEPQFMDEAYRMTEQLNRLLRPLDGEDGEKGWSFGRTVYKGDIYHSLSQISGVVFIQELWLDGDGKQVKKSAGGDLILPPQGLVYSGKHEIELISRAHL
ncbi:putative baseplate assembly protein [Paenibacillus sp. HB172176]|uniref:putative baseplate assembly protein n=1 Tax=Paenibacillus sp. HB172176 TaxID=2493690 RepID=UPI00143A1237|nr:putative baseplate assembly protein [Paenibacillus sp. HB172176]